ncbi:hypothetical protein HDV06_006535 [Boothiomyces sp. JEL0866]|nr:hypothetical protein HDV06_006535 [Boothiomyces sp. JEL0866]
MALSYLILVVPTFAISGRIYFYNNIQFYGDDYNTIVNNNCNFNSQPYSTIPATSDQCGRLCSQDNLCSHFTYELAGYCALRSGLVGIDKPFPTNDIRKCGIYGDYSKSGCSFNTGSVQCQGDPNPNGSPAPVGPPKPQSSQALNGNSGNSGSGSSGAGGSNVNSGNSPQQSNNAAVPVPTLTTIVHITTTIIQGNTVPTPLDGNNANVNSVSNASPTATTGSTGVSSATNTPSDSNSGDLPFTSRILIIVGAALAVIVVLLIPFFYLLNRLMKRKQEMIQEAKEARKEAAAASNRVIERRFRRSGHRPGMLGRPPRPGMMGASEETVVNTSANFAQPSRLSTVNEGSAEE